MKKKLLSLLFFTFTIVSAMEDTSSEDSPPSNLVKEEIGDEELNVYFQEWAITDKDENSNNNNDIPEAPVVRFPQVHFSPNIAEVVQKLIQDEKEEIKGALFQFTYYPIAEAMAENLKKNIPISLVIDRGGVEKKTDKDGEIPLCLPLNMIIKAGGRVFKKNKLKGRDKNSNEIYENMHHKFLILKKNVTDKPLALTGSFNFTGNAHQSWENIVILDDSEAIDKFEEEFNTVLGYSEGPLTAEKCVSPKDTAQTAQARYSRIINAYPDELIGTAPPRYLKPNTSKKVLNKTI